MDTPPAAAPTSAAAPPPADTSDTARLLRVCAVRVFGLALFAGVAGEALLTVVLFLGGLGLLLAPAGARAGTGAGAGGAGGPGPRSRP